MEFKVREILDSHRLMALATVRPDGWPQVTLVGYVNEGLRLYFIVSRRSQKLHNILNDERVSIAIGADARDPADIRGLSMSARISEVTDAARWQEIYELLLRRRPEYAGLRKPDPRTAAILRASPEVISVLDYSKGFGHADTLIVGAEDIVTMAAARPDDWGMGPASTH
jgi:nitroimidazol reductase NimA-like FMN-containing flavoprotein (pyridoxamine 5'-phosphate oxidase superfamily)